jgi:Ca2+-binding EF-hand superfamily protein
MTCARKVILLLSAGIGFTAAGATALASDDVRLRRLFSVMDLDGSHEVSRSEFRSGKSVVFLTIDLNGNMTLEPDEMRMSPDGFKLLAGEDGLVDGEEFNGSEIGSFDAVDKDKDDQIDYAELSEYIAKYSD